MLWADAINGGFELLAGVAVLNNCFTVWQHKQVRGVSVVSTAFFTLWGFWNVFYYPHLGQFWSCAGGVFVTLANLIYIALLLRYRQRSAAVHVFIPGRQVGKSHAANEIRRHTHLGTDSQPRRAR